MKYCTSCLRNTVLDSRRHFFAQKSPKSARNLNLRQNSECSGLKFSSESKLFGRGPPCPRKTSATLPKSTNTNTYSFGSHVQDLRVKLQLEVHPWTKGGECLNTIYHNQKVQWYILAPLHDGGISCFIRFSTKWKLRSWLRQTSSSKSSISIRAVPCTWWWWSWW